MPMNRKQLIISIIMSAMMVVFMVRAPEYIAAARTPLTMQRQREERESYQGIITVWHIAGFKPYQGSLGTWVGKVAESVEKRHDGVFIEVDSITMEEYQARIERGEQPDVFSYPLGCVYVEQLMELDAELPVLRGNLGSTGSREGRLYGVPYAASGYLLIHNQRLMQEQGTGLNEVSSRLKSGSTAAAGDPVQAAIYGVSGELLSMEDFSEGNAVAVFADVRAAGDLVRKIQNGKGFPVEFSSCGNYTDLVQFIGINVNADAEKISYIYELIGLCLREDNQTKLMSIGLMPALEEIQAEKADAEAVALMFEELNEIAAPNSFLYGTYKDQLYLSAREGMRGSASAKKDMELRLTELVRGAAIK